jgi:hypothetical protein
LARRSSSLAAAVTSDSAWRAGGLSRGLISFSSIDASAIGNRVEQLLSYRLVERPTLLGIFPRSGSVQGGTDVVIKGSGFFPGVKAFVAGEPLIPRNDPSSPRRTLTSTC